MAIAIVMLIALLRRKPLLALTAALVMGTSVGAAEVAKHFLPRPELVQAPPGWLTNSFPSGHVTVALAIGIGAVIVAPYAMRWLITIIAAIYAAGIGMDVATAGWHRLSDVFGAALLVIAVACMALYRLSRIGRARPMDRRRMIGTLIATAVLGLMAVGFGGVGLAFGFGRLIPLPLEPTIDDQLLAYSSTLLTAAGMVVTGFVAFLWLILPFAIDEPVLRPTPDLDLEHLDDAVDHELHGKGRQHDAQHARAHGSPGHTEDL